jgi:hypothetical protein
MDLTRPKIGKQQQFHIQQKEDSCMTQKQWKKTTQSYSQ